MPKKPVHKKVAFKRCQLSIDARALAEDLMEELDGIVQSRCPFIGPDYRGNLEATADRLILYADRMDMTAVALGLDHEETERTGAAMNLRRLIQTVTGVWYGGQPVFAGL